MDWNELWSKIKILLGSYWVDLWPTLKVLLTEQGQTAFNSAKNIVLNIQSTMPDATGQQKFDAALSALTAMLVAQGITLGVGILRIAVEMAYNKMVATPAVIEEAKFIRDKMSVTPTPSDPNRQVQP